MPDQSFIPFSRPEIGEDEIQEVIRCLQSGWITSGPRCEQLETDIRTMVGARHALTFSSCTAALHATMLALGVGPGDEVIVPALTWPATANVAAHCGAEVIFADIDPVTWNIDPEAVARLVTRKTKAVVPVHYAGLPVDLRALTAALSEVRLQRVLIIEDAAHALGARYYERPVGACLDGSIAACFSFHPIKNITTAEGGVAVTGNDALASRMRLWRFHGIERDAWKAYSGASSELSYDVVLPGLKYNLTDLQASIGIHQLRRLYGFNERRAAIAQTYLSELSSLPGLAFQGSPEFSHTHAHHLFPILVPPGRRRSFMEKMKSTGIGTGLHFEAVHLMTYYKEKFGCRAGQCPVAEDVCSRVVSLPLYPGLTDEQVGRIVEAVRRAMA